MCSAASLNHAYRLVFDVLKQMWIPVAETARRRGKSGRTVLLAAGVLALAGTAQALPSGGSVSAGEGHIAQSGSAMTITQASQNLALNWQGFGIGAQESVTFVQPDRSAIALNRVLGQDASQILGSLSANGQVFILNPNGVLFGAGAQVSVGGLLASTHSLSDSDFLAGHFTLAGSSTAAVHNAGRISAAEGGYVALLGAEASNSGSISAPNGNVTLAAAEQLTLDLDDGSLLGLTVERGAVEALAANSGLISANGGQVLLSAQAADDLTRAVVNHSGVIEAQAVDNSGGLIRLLGDMQTGTVTVAGTLDASAASGNGGFVETSAASVRVADGTTVTTRAVAGQSGEWLIDPADYTITASGGNISGTTLSNNLGLGNVTILSSSGTAGGNGDIHVNDAVGWSANTLTLTAARDVNINAVMSAGGSAGLVLNTGTANGADAGVAEGTVNVALSPNGFTGRVDFTGDANTLAINGNAYTIITTLGAEGSTTGSDLQGMNGNLAGRYALGANIDASATATWNGGAGFDPVGDGTTAFTGVFNGLGHVVNSLAIDRPTTDGVGLFGIVAAGSLRNVGVAGTITGRQSVGALVGDLHDGVAANVYASVIVSGAGNVGGLAGELIASSLDNAWSSGSVGGTGQYFGGLVGYSSISNISSSHSTSSVVLGSGSSESGGLVGWSEYGSVRDSHASGSISGNNLFSVGGLAGYVTGGGLADVYATGNVTGSGTSIYIGGLVGHAYGNASIVNAWASGAVTGDALVGGLAGYLLLSALDNGYATGAVTGNRYVGGLAGSLFNSTIDHTFAVGAVTAGGDNVGGLVGGISGGSASNSYWDATTTGMAASAVGIGLATAQMRQLSSFAGWSLDGSGGAATTWRIYEGYTYPLLKAFLTALDVTVNDTTLTYNGATQRPTYSLPAGADASLVLGNVAGARNAGSYTVGIDGLYSGQLGYDLTGSSGTLTIEKAALALNAVSHTRNYDATTLSNVAVNVVGLQGGDSVGNLTQSFTSKDVQGVDASTLVVDGGYSVNDGNGGNNYIVATSSAVGTIAPAPLMVRADDAARPLGMPDPAFTASYSGFAGSEDESVLAGLLQIATTATRVSAPGRYALLPSGLTAANYAIAFLPGVLTVIGPGPELQAALGTAFGIGPDDFANDIVLARQDEAREAAGEPPLLLDVEGGGIRLPDAP